MRTTMQYLGQHPSRIQFGASPSSLRLTSRTLSIQYELDNIFSGHPKPETGGWRLFRLDREGVETLHVEKAKWVPDLKILYLLFHIIASCVNFLWTEKASDSSGKSLGILM